MARNISPDSVSSKVGDLKLGEYLILPNPYYSVMVMVSNLKRKEQNKNKKFKIKELEGKVSVNRIK